MALISCDKICHPKKFGGLGRWKTTTVNMTFLSKLAWEILTSPSNFWVQQMRAKYGSPDQFFIAS